ncbi:Beta-lactamase-like protein [Thioalkalivibrio nitratireducens DSM 14787]|uniref:Beta-lactamase-like protein n=1 Tax=Thioalkalivibrio nitratireducens (strain DSM 14787 / UNIQEM 213 / ALEN2) TaxID=1255043 RepID=L0DXZ3_THIND|nr:MBL fold metallo-hydrolase [Thioalkalivibrio nitratireducens]AGA34459.1 Beta-lactamase-like protein [Thioalkalivibrio nitratireducens DSM 14787]
MHLSKMSRRRFLQLGAGSLAGAGVFAATPQITAFASDLNDFLKGPPVPDIAPIQMTEHVWMIYSEDVFPTPENKGMMCNITFVVTDEGVVVLDSGGSLQIGEMAIRMIRTVTDKPVISIFVSHYHGDHWLGNHAFVNEFGADLPIYAHPHTKQEIEGVQGDLWRSLMERWTEGATIGTRVIAPNREMTHGDEFRFGGVTLRMHHYGVAHTPSDISVEVVGEGLTYVGDVAMERRIANMDDGSFQGSIDYIDRLKAAAGSEIWIPGHGRPTDDLLQWNQEMFAGIYENCLAAVENMEDMEGARERVMADPRVADKADETRGFDANIGRYISLAYLEAEMAAF